MRNHPGRAMYDELEDALTSITMQLRSAIQADTRRVNGSGARLHVESAWTRQVTAELASVLLGTLGLAATIEWHAHQFQKCTGILCELTVNNAAGSELPDDYATAVFEAYNEALSNIARHADATRVAITLTITPRELTMAVREDGTGQVAGTRELATPVTISLPIP
jgi:two-component system sensor histidine kinase UhpB